jgi:sulfatase modifying factor 1
MLHATKPAREAPGASYKTGQPDAHIPRRVVKAARTSAPPTTAFRYRPAARQAETIDTSTAHIGFRCIKRLSS